MSTAELGLPSSQTRPLYFGRVRPSAGARLAAAMMAGWSAGVLIIDAAVIVAAFLLAYWLRFVAPDASGLALGIDLYLRVGVTVAAITVALFITHGLYDEDRPPSWPVRVRAVVSSLSTALVLAVAVAYFLGDQAFSRLWFASGWLFAVTAMLVWRSSAHRLYLRLRAVLAPSRRVLIVGANGLGEDVARELAAHHEVVGFVDNGTDLDRPTLLPLLGPISEMERIVQAFAIDELVVALPTTRRGQVSRAIARGFQRRVTVKFLSELQDFLPRRFEVHDVAGRRYIGFWSAAHVSWVKRALDVILVGLGLILLLPLFALVALAIKLDSPGPILYGQTRVGRNGRHFKMLKFRSMCQDADKRLQELMHQNEASGPLFKIRKDPRITRVGGFLRRWSLDELPQLLNVLSGDMSLVGPRPPIPSEVARYEDWQLGRLRAVPGLTGLWQVSGRSEVPFHDMVRLDLHYIRNWSFGLDLEILLRTIPAVLTNRGAY